MSYDIRCTPTQLQAAAEWAALPSPEWAADVELTMDGTMLIVAQGDDRTAFDTDGSTAPDTYLTVLDRKKESHPH